MPQIIGSISKAREPIPCEAAYNYTIIINPYLINPSISLWLREGSTRCFNTDWERPKTPGSPPKDHSWIMIGRPQFRCTWSTFWVGKPVSYTVEALHAKATWNRTQYVTITSVSHVRPHVTSGSHGSRGTCWNTSPSWINSVTRNTLQPQHNSGGWRRTTSTEWPPELSAWAHYVRYKKQ